MAALFKLLYDNGADVVIGGHNHIYERFLPLAADGTPDAARGIREFGVGTGGASLSGFRSNSANLVVRDNTTRGVLRLDLSAGGYTWQFLPVHTGGFSDAGTANCH